VVARLTAVAYSGLLKSRQKRAIVTKSEDRLSYVFGHAGLCRNARPGLNPTLNLLVVGSIPTRPTNSDTRPESVPWGIRRSSNH
jgi:hypothetical protein